MSRHSRKKDLHISPRKNLPIEPTTAPKTTVFSWPNQVMVWLFHFLVLTVPFFFTWVNEELFEFNKMMLTYGITVLILSTWVVRMSLEKRIIFKRSWLDLPILLFACSQLLSALFSIHPHTSIFGYYTRFHGGLLSTLTYIALFYAFTSNIQKKQLPNFLVTLFLAALGVSLYAIPEHFGVSPSCALISGEWNVSCWVQDVKSRVFATFGQPNWLAAYVITLIPVGFALSLHSISASSTPLLRKIFFAVTTLLCFVTLLFTNSRSGFLGFGVSMLVFASGFAWLQFFKKKSLSLVSSKTTSFCLLAFGFLLLTLLFGSPFSPSLSSYIQKQNAQPLPSTTEPTTVQANRLDTGGTDSGEIRKIVWQGALDVWKRYPLFGSGVETFAYSYYQDRPLAHNLVSEWDFLYNKAHNEVLNFLSTTGLLGLGSYLIFYTALLLHASYLVFTSQNESTSYLALGTVSGLIALFISNFFGFSTVMVSILLFLYPALLLVSESKNESESASVKNFSFDTLESQQWLAIGMTSIVSLYILFSLVSFWRADKMFTMGKQLDNAGYSVEAVKYLTEAITSAPNEALYYDELSSTYAKLAVALVQEGQATQGAQVAQAAIANSDQALALNPRHLNFYKTRARVYITLAQLNPDLLKEAKKTLEKAIELSPTEAKLIYNLGVVEISMGDNETGIKTLERAIEMKPDYEAARYALAQHYEEASQSAKALEQYHYILDNINPKNEVVKKAIELHKAE